MSKTRHAMSHDCAEHLAPGEVVIEICTWCRGTLGDQMGLNLRRGPSKGSFGTTVCGVCADSLEAEGRLDGLFLIFPFTPWLACAHIAARAQARAKAGLGWA
jgi:hypothetical protein